MTYKQMLSFINELSDEQLEMDVTVYLETDDEFFPVLDFAVTDETDVLDTDHPYIVI